jgi:hypothetical protein
MTNHWQRDALASAHDRGQGECAKAERLRERSVNAILAGEFSATAPATGPRATAQSRSVTRPDPIRP